MSEEFEPILYVIMRKDIPDMNPGKGMAQACHAGNDMAEVMNGMSDNMEEMFIKWKDGRNFGVTITLEMTEAEYNGLIIEGINDANSYYVTNTIHDPTYPIRNNYGYCYTVPMDTCWWIFVYDEKSSILPLIKQFPLHR